MIGLSAMTFFLCSSIRHALFASTAWDLGIFDQAVFLISQGQPPISSFLGFHILGDHAAWIFYPLALLYKIYPDVHCLFAVQAIALSFGGWLIWRLAGQAGLKPSQAILMAFVYLLYPLVFNINLFDFRPDVMAPAALLGAVLSARTTNLFGFGFSILLLLGCKAAFSLTAIGLGAWLIGFEKKYGYGAIAIAAGVIWFLIATQWIMPEFGQGTGAIARHASRYSYLGNSSGEIVQTIFRRPDLIVGKVFSANTLEYLLLICAPLLWGLSPRHLAPLVAAAPALALNILSEDWSQRNLIFQYSLPILPFLLLAVISALAAQQVWLKNQRAIALWSIVAFLALAKYGFFWTNYIEPLDTWQATRHAVSLVQTQGAVLTTQNIAPHLSHRPVIKTTDKDIPPSDLSVFEYVLLDVRHPGWRSSEEFAASLLQKLQTKSTFQQIFTQDQVYLFQQQAAQRLTQ
jgi:uncharacterized membrane protein